MAQHLDRSKPLWEIWIVEGLARRRPLRDDQQDPPLHGRRRVERRPAQRAAAARAERRDQGSARLDSAPGADDVRPRRRDGRAADAPAAPSRRGHRARACATRRIRAPICAPACAPCATCFSTGIAHACRRRRSTGRSARTGASTGYTMHLAEVKAVKNALGGTVNDVVLATVSGAVRRFLERHRVNVDDARLPRHGAGQRAQPPTSAARSATASRPGWCRCRSASAIRAPRWRKISETTGAAQGVEVRRSAPRCSPRSASGRRRPCCRSARA